VDHLSNQQLQASIVELDRVIDLHDQWYRNFLRVLISRVPPDQSDLRLDAHLQCPFGQWLKSRAAIIAIENQELSSLKDAHERIHSDARNFLRQISDGLVIPVKDWDHFENNRETMVLKILTARHGFSEIAKNRDPLTEVQTRAGLLAELRKQHALVLRGKQSCVLAMLDLDYFKRINDSYGHAAGDAVLVSIAQCLKSHLRPYDQVYRYGGEEFIVCMSSTTIEQASEIIERVRSSISKLHFNFGEIQVTASFGVTSLRESQSVEESISCADKAMYEAKAKGRNCVVLDV
jgi:diguanylate cyclase (GGDEF)-like protein